MPPLIEFKHAYADLIGLKYGSLNEKQKQTVYSMEIYDDSGDALIGCDIYLATDLSPDFIDQQNRETFEYTDDTIIKGNVIVSQKTLLETYNIAIAGQPYRALKESEKRILYACLLLKKEGNHPESALIFSMCHVIRYIDHQIRNTYGYEDGTIC